MSKHMYFGSLPVDLDTFDEESQHHIMRWTDICDHFLFGELQIILEYGGEKSQFYLLMPSLIFSELESTRNVVKLAEATRASIELQVSVQ